MKIKMKQFDGWTWVYFGGLVGWSRTRPGDTASTNLGVAIAMLRAGNLGSAVSTPKRFRKTYWKEYQMKDEYVGAVITIRDEYSRAVKSVDIERRKRDDDWDISKPRPAKISYTNTGMALDWNEEPSSSYLPTESKLAEYYGMMLVNEWKEEDEWKTPDHLLGQ